MQRMQEECKGRKSKRRWQAPARALYFSPSAFHGSFHHGPICSRTRLLVSGRRPSVIPPTLPPPPPLRPHSQNPLSCLASADRLPRSTAGDGGGGRIRKGRHISWTPNRSNHLHSSPRAHRPPSSSSHPNPVGRAGGKKTQQKHKKKSVCGPSA